MFAVCISTIKFAQQFRQSGIPLNVILISASRVPTNNNGYGFLGGKNWTLLL
jgi:hypothetical protein